LQRNGNSNRHARAERLDFQGVFEGKARRMLKKSATEECAIKIQAGVSNDVAAGAGPFSRETATYRCMHLPHTGTAPWLAPRRRPATATKVSCLRSRLSRLFDHAPLAGAWWLQQEGCQRAGASPTYGKLAYPLSKVAIEQRQADRQLCSSGTAVAQF
jgi:hypothetical protein